MHFTHPYLRSFAAIGASVAMATAASAAPNDRSAEGFTPSVIAMDQKLQNDEVSITYAYLPKDGRLTILAVAPDGKGEPTVLGSTDLSAGDHRNVKVSLTEAPQQGAQLKARVEASEGEPFAGSDDRTKMMFGVM
jgi:hypothetical protein